MTTLSRPIGGLLATLRRLRGESGTYRRGSTEILATMVRTKPDTAAAQSPYPVDFRAWDLLVDADDLAALSPPRHGDEIDLAEDGVTSTYQVMPHEPDGQVFRFMDPTQRMLRIHAKLTGSV